MRWTVTLAAAPLCGARDAIEEEPTCDALTLVGEAGSRAERKGVLTASVSQCAISKLDPYLVAVSQQGQGGQANQSYVLASAVSREMANSAFWQAQKQTNRGYGFPKARTQGRDSFASSFAPALVSVK